MGKLVKAGCFNDIRALIVAARERVAVSVNAELTMLYWKVGRRINRELLSNKRAEYGKQVIDSLAEKLQAVFGKGWDAKTLRHCLRAAETFSEAEIVSAVKRQLSWTQRTIWI